MKKIILVISIIILSINISYGYSKNCKNERIEYETIKNELEINKNKQNEIEKKLNDELKGSNATRTMFLVILYKRTYDLRIEHRYKTIEIESLKFNYNSCNQDRKIKLEILLSNGDYFYKNKDYLSAIKNYKEYIKNKDMINYNYAIVKLGNSLNLQGSIYVLKNDYIDSIKLFKNRLTYNNKDTYTLNSLGLIYLDKKDYVNSKKYIKLAYEYANNPNDIIKYNSLLKNIINEEKLYKEMIFNKKESNFNDKYSYKQYYMNQLNIPNAQKSFKLNKQVIIAVIDDGINLNHPDLSDNIWVNNKEIPGNGIDDDNNGYIDDYNGWNFASDNYTNIIPSGSHGTNVAGIIGAKINNYSGISGIVKNVKIMNLRAFEFSGGAYTLNIINAINYAINNGADIINLSLGSNHLLRFNNKYDEIIKKANKKGIILVIASGNGDLLSNNTEGVNTTINKLSPICNDYYVNNVIGVGSTNKEGFRAKWSNYGNCVDVYAPGTNIFTLSTLSKNTIYGDKYDIVNGTSFSAPIISGIVGLGFNKYGKVNASIIKIALQNSIISDTKGYYIDSLKYLNELGKLIKDENKKIEQNKIEQHNYNVKNKVYKVFSKVKKIYNRYSETKRKTEYEKILNILEKAKNNNTSGDKKIIIDYLIILINLEIGNLNNYSKMSNDFLNNILDNIK